MALPVSAHNGAVAIAEPVEGITVDGDLSDWPADMARYPVRRSVGFAEPQDEVDLSAAFRVGFDPGGQTLYVAVEVQDESAVLDTTGQIVPERMWEAQDGCEVYVDATHGERESPALQYLIYGKDRGRHPLGPGLGGSSLGVRQTDWGRQYEWAIQVSEVSELQDGASDSAPLRPGMTLGFDVSICDKDADGSFTWAAWGPGGVKQRYTGSRGNLVLTHARELVNLTLEDLGAVSVRDVMQDRDGSMWFATWSGVRRGTGRTYENPLAGALDGVRINRILQDRRGYIWFGTVGQGVYRYDGADVIAYLGGHPSEDHVHSVLEDRTGTIWFGTYGGLRRFDGDSFYSLTKDDGMPSTYVPDLLQNRNGDLWLATARGVSRYDGQEFVNYTTQDGLAADGAVAIAEDHDGNLWFATWRGVSRYDGASIRSFTTEDGLACNGVSDVLVDDAGSLWFGLTQCGVARYDGLVFQTITAEHGLPSDNVIALYQDQQGGVWILTDGGASRYSPQSGSPEIAITNTIADGEHGDDPRVRVPSQRGYFAFEFAGSSPRSAPGDLAYVYRLSGHDLEWRTTRERRVAYSDLPRGEYIFEVKAVDRDLNYSTEPAIVTLTVHLPYERIAWLSALVVAVVLVVGQTGRVLRRDRRLRLANRELSEANRQIQRNTRNKSEFLSRMSHDLRTPMNAIIGYTRILTRRLKGAIEDRQYGNLENIQTSASNLLNLINEILDLSRIEAGRIDLEPEAVDLVELVGECITSVAPLVKPGVELVQELGEAPAINTDADRIRRVVMNLLGNAVKFTEEGSITVSLKPVESRVELSVADTGVGIPAEDLPHIFKDFHQVERQVGEKVEGTGLGLAIAKKSVDMLGGTISAESEVGRGTTFTMWIGDYAESTV